jgi:hypothetical protein
LTTPSSTKKTTAFQRAKIRRFIAQVALELDDAARDTVDLKHAERQRRQQKWGEAIRQHARNLQAQLPPEPAHITAARRQTLLDNTR